MNLGKIIAGIKQNIAIRQRGVYADQVMIDRRELQFLMSHFDSMETELRVIHARRASQSDNTTATEYLLSSANNANRLRESVERIKQTGPAKAVFLEPDVFDIHQMIIDQNPERRSKPRQPLALRTEPMVEGGFYNSAGVEATPLQIAEQRRKPVTSLDWELQQALIHLQNAISVTDSHRAHLLTSCKQIIKGVRESD